MTVNRSSSASIFAADYAAAARRSLPDPGEVAAGRIVIDPAAAAAYASLAAYYQMHALLKRLDQLPSAASAIRANTDMVDHISGGVLQVIRELNDGTAAITHLDRTVEQVLDTPGRRLARSIEWR